MIYLTKPWEGKRTGSRLSVLRPGEEIRPGAVDAVRAAHMIAEGMASTEPPKKPKAEKRGRDDA